MAQKKKILPASKASDKSAVRKPAPVKAAAPPAKSVKPSKPEAAAKAAVAPAVKAKAPVAAAAVVKPAAGKKAPLAIKIEAKPAAAATAPAPQSLKKPAAGLLKAAVAAAKQAQQGAAAQPARAVPAAVQKTVGQKLTAPVAAPAQPVQTPKAIAEKAAAARQMLAAQKKPVSQRHGFKANEFIVYPAHGVGRIIGIEEQEIAGMSLELFVINFEKEKLTLRVPTGKLTSVGMRKLADDAVVKKAMEILKGRARIKRTMWSRRAQEYVAKINSGDLISIAEVVRDLYRSEAQPEQSYSERQLYEDALDRMAREIAAVEKLDERGAVQRITEVLSKSAKSRRIAGEGESVGEAA